MQKYCNRITNYGEWESLHCTNLKPNNHNTECSQESELLSVFSELHKTISQRSLYKVTCSNFIKHQFSLHTVLPSYDDITISQYMVSYEAMTV